MNWQKELENKFNQIKKEEEHVRSRIDIRHNVGRISGSICVSVNQEINKVNKREEKVMITVEGALKDLETIEKEATDNGSKAVVKALKVIVKFLSTIRSNQLLTEAEKLEIAKVRKERQNKEKVEQK